MTYTEHVRHQEPTHVRELDSQYYRIFSAAC